jgi:hypothetical protein
MATKDPGNRTRPSEVPKDNYLEWKRRIMVFSFFLVISVIIWLLNALSKDYTTAIKYPIAYSRFPQDKVLISEVPDHLGLTVTGHGYALLSYKLSNRPIPISFPVSGFTMNRMPEDTTKFYILTRYARDRVERQLSGELKLVEIFPDTLVFQFANEVDRWLPMEPVIEFGIGKGFTLIDEVEISPESIMVTGPDIYLDTMQSMRTEKLVLGTLEKNYRGTLRIANYPGLNYQKSIVNCVIRIEKLTEVQVRVPVQISGLPDSLRMQTFPQQVTVKGMIGLSDYERVVPEAFRIEVNYDDVLENKNRLEVQMRTSPDELMSADFYPRYVEYLLSVK